MVTMTVNDIFEINHSRSDWIFWHMWVVKLYNCTLLIHIWLLVGSTAIWIFEFMALIGLYDLIVISWPPLNAVATAPLIFKTSWLILHCPIHKSLSRPNWTSHCPINTSFDTVFYHAIVVKSFQILMMNFACNHHLLCYRRCGFGIYWHLVIHYEFTVKPIMHIHLLITRWWHCIELLTLYHCHYLFLQLSYLSFVSLLCFFCFNFTCFENRKLWFLLFHLYL